MRQLSEVLNAGYCCYCFDVEGKEVRLFDLMMMLREEAIKERFSLRCGCVCVPA
jgi:hypothetical protein